MAKNDCMLRHVRLFVRPSAWNNNSVTDGQFFMNIWGVIKDVSREFIFQQNLTRITGTLYNGISAFDTVSMYPSEKEKRFRQSL
jgi:hypothetical protein